MKLRHLPRAKNPPGDIRRLPYFHPRTERGQAGVALLFWLVGLTILFAPFLREQSAPDQEGDDPGRLLSEIDIPFDEDVSNFEEDFELPLGDAIASESERWFGEESELLRDSELIELGRLEAGERAYVRYCLGCHGSTGDGAGAAARYLEPRPRNFRRGLFKFTSTSTGEPPLRRDLFQTITRGLAGSSMPEFRLLSEERRWDLVEYVRYLAMRGSFEQLMLDLAWEDEEVPDPDEVAEIVMERWAPENMRAVYPAVTEIPMTAETIARGEELFVSVTGANCAACHGPGGKGDGPAAYDFKDEWGYPVKPRDLTRGVFRAGSEAADLYRSIATGITGTPMPSYASSIEPEDIWSLVHFIQNLRVD